MKKTTAVWSLLLMLALTLIVGCGGDSSSNPPAPLSADNINLIFVVSPDLAYNTPGDIQPDTANLTSQGLNRSLMLATYLKQQVLGSKNASSICALEPMTHLQTANNYPDMTAIGFIQQFAMLNQIYLLGTTANSFPIGVGYTPGSVPSSGVATPTTFPASSQGLAFNDKKGDNLALVNGIIQANLAGFYVFSAPWETISALLKDINTLKGYNLKIPASFSGSNYVYALSIPASGSVSLVTYNSNLKPPVTYPVLPAPVASAACTHLQQPYFKAVRTGGVDGVVVPANTNTNQTIYIVRHADAHPDPAFQFEDGNYVGAGQWRALALSSALKGKIRPTSVYSIDPAQSFGSASFGFSYIRPSLTVLPYAIDNNLPYSLASSFPLGTNPLDQGVAQTTSEYFFTGGKFSNQTVLLGWESGHVRPFLNWLIATYGGNTPPQLPTAAVPPNTPAGGWPHQDYDTIWTVTLDAKGNLTVDNALCEGIDSSKLPATAPLF